VAEDQLAVGDCRSRILADADPARLPWGELGIDVVLESTGIFKSREQAEAHLAAGARKVLISAPAEGVDALIVLGVNDDALTMVLGGNLAKVLGRYDNEWGYANRCVDLIPRMAA
jgi:glyceraldehyde 3-phosphate dehydrogenase